MNDHDAVLEGLGTLRADPPPTLVPDVLVRVGLTDGYVTVDSAAGPMRIGFGAAGVTLVLPADHPGSFVDAYQRRLGRDVVEQRRAPGWLVGALERPDDARLRRLPVDLSRCSAFQRDVLTKAREIPRGEVRPYGWIAREIARAGAVRAVGTALGRNPVPWLVPCHRVVRSDGLVGDYAFGSSMKRTLLSAEGAEPDRLEALGRTGIRYLASDTTGVYCYPACRNARRITDRHLVRLHDEHEAGAAGFRPCKACRPAAA